MMSPIIAGPVSKTMNDADRSVGARCHLLKGMSAQNGLVLLQCGNEEPGHVVYSAGERRGRSRTLVEPPSRNHAPRFCKRLSECTLVHPHWLEHVGLHVVLKPLAGHFFNDSAKHAIAIVRVEFHRVRWIDALRHGFRHDLRNAGLRTGVESVSDKSVIKSRTVEQQLADRNRPRKSVGNPMLKVLVDIFIQLKLSSVSQLHDRNCCEYLGNGGYSPQ